MKQIRGRKDICMNRYFFGRLFALCLVLACLFFYQNKALAWEKQEKENQKEIAEVEAYNKQMEEQAQQEEQKAESLLYADGVYEGSAKGFGGDVVVSITISQDEIQSVEVIEAKGEDSAYLSMAMALTDEIVTKQSVEVDTVSGATYSSRGILDAAKQALDMAKEARENS